MTETSEPITSSLITNTQALNDACDDFANAPFIAIDTEFMRETTYYLPSTLPHPDGHRR